MCFMNKINCKLNDELIKLTQKSNSNLQNKDFDFDILHETKIDRQKRKK